MVSKCVVNVPNDSLYHQNLITSEMFRKIVLKNVDMQGRLSVQEFNEKLLKPGF